MTTRVEQIQSEADRAKQIGHAMEAARAADVAANQLARSGYADAQTARARLFGQLDQASADLDQARTDPDRWETARDLRDQIAAIRRAIPAAESLVNDARGKVKTTSARVSDGASHRRAALSDFRDGVGAFAPA